MCECQRRGRGALVVALESRFSVSNPVGGLQLVKGVRVQFDGILLGFVRVSHPTQQ